MTLPNAERLPCSASFLRRVLTGLRYGVSQKPLANLNEIARRPTYIIGTVTDELDIPYVRRYALIAPEGN